LLKSNQLLTYGSFVVGYSNPDQQRLLIYGEKTESSTTLFNVASVSKTFTGLGILKLIQEEKVKPGDPIGNYLNNLQPALKKVTIEQLAFHTNGIHDYFTLIQNHKGITNDDVMAALAKLDSTVFEPGSNWGYTNSGYVLLAEIIEAVTQEAYSVWIKREILDPMGMESAVLFQDSKNKPVYGHRSNGNRDSVISLTHGGGNYLFTPNDFIQLGVACNQNKELNSLFKLSKGLSKPWIRDSTWSSGYGMWHGQDDFGEFVAHSGRSYGYQAYYRYYTNKKLFIFYMTNQDSPNTKKFRNELIKLTTETQ